MKHCRLSVGNVPVLIKLFAVGSPSSKSHNSVTAELGIQVLPHPAYSPDLAPCDFWLFQILKDRLAGRKFDRIQDLAKAVNSELRTIPEEDYQGVFQKW
ncbi:transposase [Elysia marginata]|uniref:Transposase n=1 Tax=Elysia marginata TaxID=1093978 RepID=A0AAV4FLQ8_9GAST|nr:transposase [Elysia marginata]